MAIPVAISRMAAFLAPAGTNAEGMALISGVLKLAGRFGRYSGVPARDAAMVLTRAEQSVLFGFGRRALIWAGGTFFLIGAVLDTVRNLVAPGEEKRTVATRLEMIQAHIVKGGPLLTRAIGVAEQVAFLLLDATGETMGDVLAGVFANVDEPNNAPPLFATLFDRNYYAELASPVADLDTVDSIIEAPGLILQPALLPFPTVRVDTFPAGPMPSWGRRS